MNYFNDLPEDLFYIITNFLSTDDKISLRESCTKCNTLINYMNIKIDIFNNLFNKILVPFRISETITQYISVGILSEWYSRFSWSTARQHQKTRKYISKDSLKYIDSNYACDWLYESIMNWIIVEKNIYY